MRWISILGVFRLTDSHTRLERGRGTEQIQKTIYLLVLMEDKIVL